MKKLLQFLIPSLLTLLSCIKNHSIDPKNIFEKASKNDSLSYYFPSILNDTVQKRNPVYNDFKQKRYSSSLYSFKEPILYTKTDSETIYRLLWLRSFHKPVCFTIKEFDGSYFLNAKTLDKEPAFYPEIESKGKDEDGNWILDTIQKADRFALIDFDTIKVLTTGDWSEIQSFLTKLNFWNGPFADPNDQQSTDGANWIIEGRKDRKYHFINRRNDNGELVPFGKYLIKLSGLNIKADDIY